MYEDLIEKLRAAQEVQERISKLFNAPLSCTEKEAADALEDMNRRLAAAEGKASKAQNDLKTSEKERWERWWWAHPYVGHGPAKPTPPPPPPPRKQKKEK